MTYEQVINKLLNECEKHIGQRDKLVDIYNKHLPLARNYKVKYSDLLCATSVSAMFISLNWTDILPTECSVVYLWKMCDALGIAKRKANITPEKGDIIFFYNIMTGTQDHVGIVYDANLTSVKYYDTRTTWQKQSIARTDRSIYGYARPKYATKENEQPDPEPVKIKAGDLVSINKGATWFNGASIPDSVRKQKWYVVQNKNGRVVLGLNEKKDTNICSPIKDYDVTLVGETKDYSEVLSLLNEAENNIDKEKAITLIEKALNLLKGIKGND